MFNSMEFFVDYQPTSVFIVTRSGHEINEMMATRVGTARIKFRKNTTIMLHDSLYFPNLTTNLMDPFLNL
jgi:hypothetical protein